MASIVVDSILKILNDNSEQILIPIYQRNYDWEKEDIIRLINDLFEFNDAAEDVNEENYFLGSMVYKPTGDIDDEIRKLILVDGQQRITSTLIILSALKKVDNTIQVGQYLTVASIKNKVKIKKLQNSDVLNKVLESSNFGRFSPEEKLMNYFTNYKAVIDYINKNDINAIKIKNLLGKTLIAWVKLTKNENENKIFETINSTGKALRSSDLIKNYIFYYSVNFNDTEEEKIIDIYLNRIEGILTSPKIRDDFFRYYVSITADLELPTQDSRDIYYKFIELISKKSINLKEYKEVLNLILNIYKSALIYARTIVIENKKVETSQESREFFFRKLFSGSKSTYFGIYFSIVNHWTEHSYPQEKLIWKLNAPKEYDILRLIAKLIIFRSISAKKDKNITRDVIKFFNKFKKNNKLPTLSGFIKYLENISADEQKIPNDEQLKLDSFLYMKFINEINLEKHVKEINNTISTFNLVDVQFNYQRTLDIIKEIIRS